MIKAFLQLLGTAVSCFAILFAAWATANAIYWIAEVVIKIAKLIL